jgi:hypothetical protein
MSETMIRTQVYLTRDIYDRLKERAEAEGITLATQIREALAYYVIEREPVEKEPILSADDPIWNMIGMLEGGPEDGSVNHDKYIYVRDWDIEGGKQ